MSIKYVALCQTKLSKNISEAFWNNGKQTNWIDQFLYDI